MQNRQETKQDEVKEIIEKSFIFDGHSDMLNSVIHKHEKGERGVVKREHMPRLSSGGIKGQIFSIFVEVRYRPEKTLKRALELLGAMHFELETSDDLALCTSGDDFEKAWEHNDLAALVGMEGIEPIESQSMTESMALFRLFYRQGVRCFGLTWQRRNLAADGAEEDSTRGGLTRFGSDLVSEMERMHVIIDVAHISTQGFYDVLKITKNPVICSHAACRALCNTPRNLTDDQITKLAEKGGVMGIGFFPTIVDDKDPSIDRVLDHIDHVTDLVGADHVGFGADFSDYIQWSSAETGEQYTKKGLVTRGLEDVTKMPDLVSGLIERGYSKQEIKKFLGGNFLRLFKKVLR
jgi:membrane dipeptidase